MRRRTLGIGTLLLLTLGALVGAQSGNDLYQQGLARETVGDIPGAMQIFERIVRESSSNRPLTARALVQLGRWNELFGRDAARSQYERVVREFGDQKEAAAEARARLDVMAQAVAPNVNPARRLVVDWTNWYRTRGASNSTLTRDGRHVIQYNEEQRAFELVEVGTGNVRQLTTDGPDPAEVLVTYDRSLRGRSGATIAELSTDGRRLATIVFPRKPRPAAGQPEIEQGELRVFEVGGRGPGRMLYSGSELGGRGRPFAWSPTGDRIWLWILRRDQSAQIASVDMTGQMRVLKTLTWRDHTQPPSLSPDGRFLAYHDATDRQSPSDVYIIATDGSREQRIEHPAVDNKPIFLPDGSGIVFESNRRGVRDLWFQGVTDGRPTGEPRLVWRSVGAFGSIDRFTETGSLAFYFATNDWATYTVPMDLSASVPSIGEPTRVRPVANESNSGAAFSPDGRYLAHFRANGARLVLRELTTGLEREIPFGAQLGASYAGADWCSTGDKLIASGYVEGAGDVAYSVNLKDSSVQRLPLAPSRFSALCVGDGEEIIYVPSGPITPPGSIREPRSIVRRSLASGRETTLFTGFVETLARSMDGTRLAFVISDLNAGVARLVTMSATGGDVSANLMTSGLVQPPQGRSFPAMGSVVWMPGGDRLLVVRLEPDSSGQPPTWIWEVPVTGAAPRKLGLLKLPKVEGTFLGAHNFTVHPDGKELAFQSHEGFVQQTWAIDNLAQFIKAGGGW